AWAPPPRAPRNCGRPTSSTSCRPRPRPGHGAPSPSRARPAPAPRGGDRRGSVTPDATHAPPIATVTTHVADTTATSREEHRGGVMITKRFLGLALSGLFAVAARSPPTATPAPSAAPTLSPPPAHHAAQPRPDQRGPALGRPERRRLHRAVDRAVRGRRQPHPA